jgi:type IV secretion system protein VirB4
LGLGAVALALCGTSAPGTQARIDAALAEHGCEGFEAFLRNAGLDWAADRIDGFSTAHAGTMPMDLVEAAKR